MTSHTCKEIATKMKEAGWNGIRLEFAMRGEPTLNPNFIKNIHIFHKQLNKSSITTATNGNKLNPTLIKQYFKAGGNVLLVDCYNGNLPQREKEYKQQGFKVTNYYKDTFNPYQKNPKAKVITLMDDIKTNSNKKKTRILHNMGGNVDWQKVKHYGLTPLKKPLTKKCTNPFREIIFLHDGTIPLCCHDSAINTKISNIKQTNNLQQLWQKNKKLNIARILLYNKRRDKIKPCNNCDSNGGMRIGLLPKMKTLTPQQIDKISTQLYK
jgi:hypothetical protein